MINLEPLELLPIDIQADWQAQLKRASPTSNGVFRLVGARRTGSNTYESQRITVLVVDENGFSVPSVPVAFAYSTADPFQVTPDYRWAPPERRAFIVPTHGSGEIDQIQGDAVADGEPGGVTVFILTPEFSSDVVTGAGMLHDHTGLHLTYQLQRTGVASIESRLAALEGRVRALKV